MDPRRKSTRKRLRLALVNLLHEADFDDIRVAQLTEQADVALPTFYRNYRNKVGLLQDTIQNITEFIDFSFYKINKPLTELLNPETKSPTLPLFQFIEINRPLFRRLLNIPEKQFIFETASKTMAKTIHENTPEWSLEEVELITGCVIGNLYQWVLLDFPYTAEEMAQKTHLLSIYGVLLSRDEHGDVREIIRNKINQED